MPNVSVETISFRTKDGRALPLLKDHQALGQPEWMRGKRSDPAAYRIPDEDETVVIEVTFSSQDLQDAAAEIRALRAGGPIGVGDINPTEVTFNANGQSEPTEFQMQLKGGVGVGVETVEWIWEAKSGGHYLEVDRTTHEIALVLADPASPWTIYQSTGPDTTPWWEVLRLACDAAAGSHTFADAADRITKVVYSDWGGSNYQYGESSNYATSYSTTGPHVFDCARFLRLLAGSPEPELVDCADTASIVRTFAAILGCPVSEKVISANETRHLLMVGHADWRDPSSFGLHEFAVVDGHIWDACLQLNTSEADPTSSSAKLPTEMLPDDYLDLLLEDPFRLTTLEKPPMPRSIGEIENLVPAKEDDILVQLASELLKFKPPQEPVSKRRVTRIDLSRVQVGVWRLIDSTQAVATMEQDSNSKVEPVARAVWRHDGDGALITCDVSLCKNAQAAVLRSLATLGRLLPFSPRPVPGALKQELAFETSEGQAIVATFLNTSIHVRGASKVRVGPEVGRQFLRSIRDQMQ